MGEKVNKRGKKIRKLYPTKKFYYCNECCKLQQNRLNFYQSQWVHSPFQTKLQNAEIHWPPDETESPLFTLIDLKISNELNKKQSMTFEKYTILMKLLKLEFLKLNFLWLVKSKPCFIEKITYYLLITTKRYSTSS